jgi:transcriptional regulator with XRE-family HTH domain
MNQIKIGEFLKELRKEKGLTQEQLAEQFNVSRRSVSRWETGNNMPDLSMLITLAEYYEVDVKEIIDGKRKSENMNEEMKDTLEKVASYNEMLNLKSMRKGIITMCIVFIILVIISTWKELSPAPLVSMICAYNGATLISKAREGKDKSDFVTGSIFFAAMMINTIAFVLK